MTDLMSLQGALLRRSNL